MSSIQNFSRNLRRLRIARGLTQEQLAEKTQTGYKYLQRIEGEVVKGLHFSTLDRFAKVLGVESAQLISDARGHAPKIKKGRPRKNPN